MKPYLRNYLTLIIVSLLLLPGSGCTQTNPNPQNESKTQEKMNETTEKIVKTDAEWQKLLTPTQFDVARKKGTERAFTGEYWDNHANGQYICVCCGLPLFDSQTKFNSGTGWPSFYQPFDKNAVKENVDQTHGMTRTEAVCNRCDGHLGHVFPDGPKPTGLRYCINSASLKFVPAK